MQSEDILAFGLGQQSVLKVAGTTLQTWITISWTSFALLGVGRGALYTCPVVSLCATSMIFRRCHVPSEFFFRTCAFWLSTALRQLLWTNPFFSRDETKRWGKSARRICGGGREVWVEDILGLSARALKVFVWLDFPSSFNAHTLKEILCRKVGWVNNKLLRDTVARLWGGILGLHLSEQQFYIR